MLEGSTSESACVCKQGFGLLSDSHCEECPAGKFKSTEQDGLCVNCPEDSSSSAGAVRETDCECQKGYTYPIIYIPPSYKTCTMCPDNTYKDVVGSSACTACPQGSGGSCCKMETANPVLPIQIQWLAVLARAAASAMQVIRDRLTLAQ